MSNQDKRRLTEQDRELFLCALSEFRKTGSNSVICDVCKVPIRFTDAGNATKHECDCGKFNGTLRGL